MTPEFGYFLLLAATLLSGTTLLYSVLQHFRMPETAHNLLERGVFLQSVCVCAAMGLLIYAHAVSDFSVANVVLYSHTAKPFLYKITGTWGNHEGSMLLWVTALCLMTLGFFYTSHCERELRSFVLALQSCITGAFLLFILATSNPFLRVSPIPPNGNGLNPLLQDIGLALHPPMLYLGYVGFSLSFSIAIAALWSKNFSPALCRMMRPYILIAWSFLTLGVGLGSWWAYRELGWGGFWFWDPVENASLMPWLVATALVHTVLLAEKRKSFKNLTLLLAILTFCFSILGTFLVRSGALISVHSFANDPARGLWILSLLLLLAGGGLLFFALRAHSMVTATTFTFLSRDTALLFNTLLLCIACLTIMLGTLYPLLLELFTDTSISIGSPYFAATFIPITLPLLVLVAFGPLLAWERDKLSRLSSYYLTWVLTVVSSFLLLWFLCPTIDPVGLIALVLACGLSAVQILQMIKRTALLTAPFVTLWQRLRKLSPGFYATTLSHMGVAILTIGIACSSSYHLTEQRPVKVGETLTFHDFQLTLVRTLYTKQENYYARQAEITVQTRKGLRLATLVPETRLYPIEKSQTTESAIYSTFKGDLYVAIGDLINDNTLAVRLYFRPLIWLIWLGVCLMTVGGLWGAVGKWRKKA